MKQHIHDKILYEGLNLDELHKQISVIIAINRLEVDMSSEEIALRILQVIFNKKK